MNIKHPVRALLFSAVITLISLGHALAQQAAQINYQAVARRADGAPVASQTVTLRLSIKEGSATGATVYSEIRQTTTNNFGLFNVVIGSSGTMSNSGTVASVNWASGNKYLQVEIDPQGGNNFLALGTSQLQSVPYAIYANSAAPIGSAAGDLSGTYPNPTVSKIQGKAISSTAPLSGQILQWNGTAWEPSSVVGAAGSQGPAGAQGIQGLTGTTGPQGPIGLTGPQGLAGIDGLVGPAGSIGQTGPTGAQGIQGLTGATGPQGAVGLQGLAGLDGLAGPAGQTGATGARGLAGLDGTTLPEATSSALGKIQLAGDLGGIASLPEVISVGGSTALQLHNAEIAANAATSQNMANRLVSRDVSGNFSAGTINANLQGNVTGNVTGNITGNVSGTATNVSGTVAVANGGTGSTSLTGYIKGDGSNAMSASATIPSTDITGLIKKVNGAFPDNNGNVAVSLGNVSTGIFNAFPVTGLTNGDMYVVSNDATAANNGRTYIYDGSTWNEITTNPAATDARYVKLGGSTMAGNLVFPSNTSLSLADAPSSAISAVNKSYVDTKLAAITIADASTSVIGKVQLTNDLGGTATSPSVISVGGSSAAAIHTAELLANSASSSTGNNTVVKRDASGNFSAGTISANLTGNVSGTANNVTGIVSIANGGTAASTAAGARANLSLENVNNTADADKPMSTLTKTYVDVVAASLPSSASIQNGLNLKLDANKLGAINGAASLDANGKIPTVQLPAISIGSVDVVANQNAMLALGSAITGSVAIRTDLNKNFILTNAPASNLSNWSELLTPGAPVQSVNGMVGSISLTKTEIGLANAENTSDENKPLSADSRNALALKANLASPALSGIPTAPTADLANNSTQIATTAFVNGSMSAVSISDASASTKGKIQLAGDLAGTNSSAATPIISNNAITTNKIADAAVTTDKIVDLNVTDAKIAGLSGSKVSGNIAGNAANVTGTIGVANGGTGAITATDARTNLGAEALSNKSTAVDLGSTLTSDDKYPSQKAVKTYVDAQTGAAGISDGSITNAKLAGSIASSKLIGTDIATVGTITAGTWNGTTVAVANGGTGASTLTGYVKGNGTSSLTASATIPASAITGLITKVNGSAPGTDGNVSVAFGTVSTGTLANRPTNAGANGNIYVVSLDTNTSNNGRTYISDGTNWNEVTSNQAATDARYLQFAGGTLAGSLTIPTAKVLTITDAPSNNTDATNKSYVDAAIANSTIADATSSSAGKIQLAGDLAGVGSSASSPKVGSVGGSTAALINSAEVLANAAVSTNTANQLVKRDASGNFDANIITANLTGNATNVTGTVAVANGGTGAITAAEARTNLGVEALSNKSTAVDLGSTLTSDDKYPSQKAVKTYVDAQTAAAGVSDGSITNAKLAGSIAASKLIGTDIAKLGTITEGTWNGTTVAVANGGSGATSLTGYLIGNGTSAFSSSASIPASAITGLIKKVNGSAPDVDGNVSVAFGTVSTGTLATRPINAGTNGNIYVVSGDATTAENGRTFISDGTNWKEVTSNQSATDARYLKLAGGTLAGNIVVPTTNKITLTDAPTVSTDAVNKAYVDASTASASIADATTSTLGKIQLAGDLAGSGTSAASPKVSSVGGSTAALINSAEVLANAAVSANTVNQLVKRDANGDFSARTISANLTGTVTGNATNVTGLVAGANGGTGVANTNKTITIGGNFETLHALKFTTAGGTNLTLPTSGTLATVQQLDAKEIKSNKSTAVDLGSTLPSDDKYPSQKAVKTYVDAQTAAVGVSDGSITNAKLAGSIAASKLIGTDIATVGTITAGTWSATTIAVEKGGTGAITAAGALSSLGAEASSNKSTAVDLGSTLSSDDKYPSQKAVKTYVDGKVSLVSPAFTGIPTAPTATSGISTTQIATTAFVAAALSAVASPINGYTSALQSSGGNSNVGLGFSAASSTIGNYNISLGTLAMSNVTSGDDNVIVGSQAARYISRSLGDWAANNQSMKQSVFVGSLTRASNTNSTNEIVIGYSATGNGSNTIQLGNTAITNTKTSGTIIAGTVTYPNTHNAIDGQVLTTNAAGVASWKASVPITGNTAGDMLYWNGTAWVRVAPGTNGQSLIFFNGKPIWSSYTASSPSPSLPSNTVYNPITNKIWMDRNLGATRVATSSTDGSSYSDLYQWGRGTDGHQIRTSNVIIGQSSSTTPGTNFLTGSSNWYSGTNPDNLWQGVSGINNPCPTGFRIPTETEWNDERLSWSSDNSAGAFASPLKLTLGGYRDNGSLANTNDRGIYWSSTVMGTSSRYLFFGSSGSYMDSFSRAGGFSVRCLKD